ncbi:MAG: hypothetical protein OEZ10_12710 [Gammaproteobacteria bacterium]|nr:hypothetical protein [Gammaproteobacteria bacterium]
MAENNHGLYVPELKVSAWVAETDPKDAATWLSSLPLANAPEAAREIYQSLYTLNRQKLPVSVRLKLMALFDEPVSRTAENLAAGLRSGGMALNDKKRRLADFIRQVRQEMAVGYKIILIDALNARLLMGKQKILATAAQQAIRYLAEVLQSCYQVYVPIPVGIWKELHTLYRIAEQNDFFGQTPEQGLVIEQRYRDAMLLGLCNPYQLPEGEWRKIAQFISLWGDVAVIHGNVKVSSVAGQFLVDLDSDRPPVAYPRGVSVTGTDSLRVLNALPLTATVQDFVRRFKKGEPGVLNKLGVDCLHGACLDMLRRMRRSWGLATGRRGDRIRKSGQCFVANSINAIHFFASGQRAFVKPLFADSHLELSEMAPTHDEPASLPEGLDMDIGEPINSDYLDFDDTVPTVADKKPRMMAESLLHSSHVYRVETWQIYDESPSGLQLNQKQVDRQQVRVGDILGVADGVNQVSWRLGVVRWIKTPEPRNVDIGIEMLGGPARPVAIKKDSGSSDYCQALLLPSVPILKRPATLVTTAGMFEEKASYQLVDGETGEVRRITALKLADHSNAFEHFVFADSSQA